MIMRYYNRYSIESFIFSSLVILVLFLIRFFSSDVGQIILFAAAIIVVVFLFLRWLFLDTIYENFSVKFLPKQFVINNNTIRNNYCTVILTSGQQVVVMDNDYVNNSKRMFSISKTDLKVNKTWNRICKMFNESSNLDSLAAFFNIEINVNIITFDTREPEKNEIMDSGSSTANANQNSVPKEDDSSAKNIHHENASAAEEIKTPTLGKIDVNYASADELSALPGINIIGAKKIVEYRNLNGLFQSEEDFIKAAGVKEHFIPKIKTMIIVGKTQDTPEFNDDNEGRIVDF